MADLDGRVVLITGAGRGMGAAMARVLAQRGARVVVGARSEDELAALAQELVAVGGEVAYLTTDVTSPTGVQALSDLALERFGRLDVAVANAGVAVNAPLAAAAIEDWDRMIDVNLRGLLHTIAATVPVFRAQGSGHFVTIGSTSASKWVPGQGVYAATKAAARALTDVLRQELAPASIRTTFISPGFTATGFIGSTRDPEERAALEARRDAIAMPPEAVAAAVLFALTQPDSIDVGELTVRPTVQP
jgi:NADP-dependent 3-hydroxy acid dehydrogenase YdfG